MSINWAMLLKPFHSGALTPTGWVITTDWLYKVHTFLTSGVFSYVYSLPVEYLIVWWWGWWGWQIWGGGWAGWFLTNLWWTKDTVSGNLAVTVWLWWAGWIADDITWYGLQWGNSSFNWHTAIWGGGWFCRWAWTAYNGIGTEANWGSWGWWADKWVNYPWADNVPWGTWTVGQWNNGWASGGWWWSTGWGWGAGWAGWTWNTPFNGQWWWAWNWWDWLTSAISWTNIYYAWGGWGWMYNWNNPAEWGQWGGGNWWDAPFPTVVRTDWTDWLWWWWGGWWNGETGWDWGSGVVIIRYLISDLT